MKEWIKYYVKLAKYYLITHKLYLIGICLWLVIVSAISTVTYNNIVHYKYTGEAWCISQGTYLDSISVLADEMDTVYTLYIMGVMDEQDFQNEVLMLHYKYTHLFDIYMTHQKNHPVKPETWTWAAKKGSDAITSIWESIGNLLKQTYTNEDMKDISTLAYNYLAYKENIQSYVDEYKAAYILILSDYIQNEVTE